MTKTNTATDTQDKAAPRGRGRPVEKPMPEPIPDTPENVARALLTTPPKGEDEWDYLKGREILCAHRAPKEDDS